MFNRILPVVTAALLVIASVGADAAPDVPLSVRAQPGAVYSVEGKTLDGKPFSLTQYRGNVTLVQFWATWCPTCRHDMPMIQKLVSDNKSKGLRYIGISLDDDANAPIAYAKEHGYTIPYAWQGAIHTNLPPAKGTPTYVLIDKNGKLVSYYAGAMQPGDLEELKDLLKAS